MKRVMSGLHTLMLIVSTAGVAFAEEAAKEGEGGGGYEATAYVWFALIAVIVVYGIYDSFFRPVD
jgi:hypothetical protein